MRQYAVISAVGKGHEWSITNSLEEAISEAEYLGAHPDNTVIISGENMEIHAVERRLRLVENEE